MYWWGGGPGGDILLFSVYYRKSFLFAIITIKINEFINSLLKFLSKTVGNLGTHCMQTWRICCLSCSLSLTASFLLCCSIISSCRLTRFNTRIPGDPKNTYILCRNVCQVVNPVDMFVFLLTMKCLIFQFQI